MTTDDNNGNDVEWTWGQSQDDEDDFLAGKTCNPDAPEECESCQ